MLGFLFSLGLLYLGVILGLVEVGFSLFFLCLGIFEVSLEYGSMWGVSLCLGIFEVSLESVSMWGVSLCLGIFEVSLESVSDSICGVLLGCYSLVWLRWVFIFFSSSCVWVFLRCLWSPSVCGVYLCVCCISKSLWSLLACGFMAVSLCLGSFSAYDGVIQPLILWICLLACYQSQVDLLFSFGWRDLNISDSLILLAIF